ncbi:MAG: hypothetical protein QME47_01715 [Candidatus Thermoplasmatota archaeon]|nr:hypothetical protein [Candidatus Thermoplasmatota archaeon]
MKVEDIIKSRDQSTAREAIQVATLVWAMLSNENPRLHVHVPEGGDINERVC